MPPQLGWCRGVLGSQGRAAAVSPASGTASGGVGGVPRAVLGGARSGDGGVVAMLWDPSSCQAWGSPGGLGQAQHSASSQAQGCRSISSLLLSHGCSGPEASETLWELWRGSCWEPSCSSACLDAATSPLSLLRKRRIILKKICVCVRVQGCIWPARAAAA